MSDLFYRALWYAGFPAFWVSSSPVVVGAEHVPRSGPFILAANHTSPYDIPLLMRHAPRLLDFVSITEVFKNPFVAWLYGSMNAFPLDRSRPDVAAVQVILRRLKQGRAIAMFPEGGFRRGPESVFATRRIRPGIGRIASLAQVPIVPCVLIDTHLYSDWTSWMPFKRTRYAVGFGTPIRPDGDPSEIEVKLVCDLISLREAVLTRFQPHEN